MEDVPHERLFVVEPDEVPQESLWDDEHPTQAKPPPDSTPEQVQQEPLPFVAAGDDSSDEVPQEPLPLVEPSTDVPQEPLPLVEPSTASSDVQKPLDDATSLLARARLVSDSLFKEARNWPEFGRVLATPERNAQFESKLLARAKKIDSRLGTGLSHNALEEMVERLARRLAAYVHSPDRQRERQCTQARKRRRRNLGRDLQIVRYYENGESQRRIANRFDISRGAVQHVLRRDRRRKDQSPPD